MIRTHLYMREGNILQDGRIHVVYHSCIHVVPPAPERNSDYGSGKKQSLLKVAFCKN